MKKDIKISSNKNNVSAYIQVKEGVAACDISIFDNDEWFINRVKVPNGTEGKGIGSAILTAAIKEIKKYNPKSIFVTPGGYANNERLQFKFYKKNGFIETKKHSKVLYYSEFNEPSLFE